MIGKTVSHYEVLERVGAGGMGVVYKALDVNLDRFVALKFLPPHVDLADDVARLRERFVQEAKAASALDHSNIGTIYEIGETEDGQTFIAMAYYEGETLDQKIARGPLPVGEAAAIARQLAQGLAQAHEKRIVHRDIKPTNLMVTTDGTVKIIDFGLARLSDATRITQKGAAVGTVAYMSPEAARGQDVDERSDVWSLGVVFYEILTGRHPFGGKSAGATVHAVLYEDLPAIRAQREDVPEALERIAARALEKNRDKRYATAAEMADDLEAYEIQLLTPTPRASSRNSVAQHLSRPAVAVPLVVLLLLAGASALWYFERSQKIRWVREEALPELQRLAEKNGWVATDAGHQASDMISASGADFSEAYALAKRAASIVPDDPILEELWPRITRNVSLVSEPPRAKVYRQPYVDPEASWEYIGETPLEKKKFPRGFSRVRVEKPGYAVVYAAAFSNQISDMVFVLDEEDRVPRGMVRVPARTLVVNTMLNLFSHLAPVALEDFWIDAYEVTNEDFQRFVDAGGYEKRELFGELLGQSEQRITWEDAKARFVDKTGRPGPATWEVGDFPEGQDAYPVSGVSWYEAAAYCQFVGKRLPTAYHWNGAAEMLGTVAIVPLSNFNGKGPTPVGAYQGMTSYGVYDMAGNVREWCWNAAGEPGDSRYILGGGWSDNLIFYTDALSQPALDRSPINGFRCMKPVSDRELDAAWLEPIELPVRDFAREDVVSDDVFAIYERMYAYDERPLNTKVEKTYEEEADWIREKVGFDAAYGNERMWAHLFIPREGTPPYQAVIYFPGSPAVRLRSSETLPGAQVRNFDYIVKSGRVVVHPILKSTFERGDGLMSPATQKTSTYRDHVIMWVQDVRRTVDYLRTRSDIEPEQLAYYGFSWGGKLGGLIPALEKRFKTAVILTGGLRYEETFPEVDPFHFTPRIRMPVLMLNGRYDHLFPLESSQRPMFELLGTPTEDKRHALYESGHQVPRNMAIKEILNWLDKYLGPVN